MAYFDSEKNKAMWERRLSELSREKGRRAENGYKPQASRTLQTAGETSLQQRPKVRIITFQQLIEKEEAKHRRALQQAKKARVAENTMAPAVKEKKGMTKG